LSAALVRGMRDRLRRRAARRQAQIAAETPRIRETTFQIVREVGAPLVEAGLARLEWTEPTEGDDWYADGAVKLIPAKDSAAAVEVFPEFAIVTLLVGPRVSSHEVVVDKMGRWQAELRGCLEAVVGGRYREKRSRGRLAREVMTMTFELPGTRNITVKHADLTAEEPDTAGRYGEHRFDGYA
jgi:hypothetical protein